MSLQNPEKIFKSANIKFLNAKKPSDHCLLFRERIPDIVPQLSKKKLMKIESVLKIISTQYTLLIKKFHKGEGIN